MKNFIALLFSALLLLMLAACTPGEGYGVLLWSENNKEFKNGDIINILTSSKLNESFEIMGKDKKTKVMIPWWRMEFFKSLSQAKKYAAEYKKYINMFVYATKEGIPVRDQMSNDNKSKILYKFKENQVGKVLGVSAKKVTVGNLEGFWYNVLLQNEVPIGGGRYTSVGIKGYCFGYYLQVTDSDDPDQIAAESSQVSLEGDSIENLFTGNWRPIGFQDMIDAGKINLDKFNPAWGIFPDKENKKISIVMDKIQFTAEYKEITKIKENTYTFPDSSLKLEILSPYRMSATFMDKDQQVNLYFANIKKKLDEIIEEEKKRRDEIYKLFYSQSKILSSSAYGTIELKENREFSWSGFEKLIPAIIPKQINGAGTISFNNFLSTALESKYDGVITIRFAEYAPKGGINFLYKFTDNGVKLFYIDSGTITDNEVSREGSNQFIIFFNFEES